MRDFKKFFMIFVVGAVVFSGVHDGWAQQDESYANADEYVEHDLDYEDIHDVLPEVLYQYGKSLYYRSQWSEAVVVFQKILKIDSHHQGALSFLKKIHATNPQISMPEYEQSLKTMEEEHKNSEKEIPQSTAAKEESKDIEEINLKETEEQENPGEYEARVGELNGQMDEINSKALALVESKKAPSNEQAASGHDSMKSDEYGKQVVMLADQLERMDQFVNQKNQMIDQLQKELADTKESLNSMKQDNPQDSDLKDQQIDDCHALLDSKDQSITQLKNKIVDLQKEHSNLPAQKPTADISAQTKNLRDQLADKQLELQENAINLEQKSKNLMTLQEKFDDVQMRLELVQKIIEDKNAQIQQLQEDLKRFYAGNGQP